LAALSSLCLPPGETLAAEEPVPVVVTIPVLKDWAEQIGGPHVRVLSLLSGLENEHSYSPRPSDLVALRKAKVLLQVGLGLEIWVSSLVKNSGNRDLKTVTTSDGVELIRDHEPPARAASPHDGGHHQGNPHVWLDPENAKIMIRHITDALSQVDPVHDADYRKNEAAYVQRLDQLQTELTARLSHLPERRIIVHHPAWPYFARRFGFEIAGEIMTQAGSEPSAHHIQTLIARIRKQNIRIIVSEPQLNQRVPEVLARETGARVIVLTAIPGGVEGTATYLDMLRYNVLHLANALDRA
jgi:ABC-type Zn uptake system ZnuABC Zn-binding protein ZnuA